MRNLHLKGVGGTVTICFRDALKGKLLEAWRILRAVAGDRAIAPSKVEEWFLDVVDRSEKIDDADDVARGRRRRHNPWHARAS